MHHVAWKQIELSRVLLATIDTIDSIQHVRSATNATPYYAIYNAVEHYSGPLMCGPLTASTTVHVSRGACSLQLRAFST